MRGGKELERERRKLTFTLGRLSSPVSFSSVGSSSMAKLRECDVVWGRASWLMEVTWHTNSGFYRGLAWMEGSSANSWSSLGWSCPTGSCDIM